MDTYIAENLQTKKEIEEKRGQSLRKVADSIGAIYLSKVFVCTRCGSPLPYPVLRFFDFDVEKVLCYRCQGLT